MRRRRFWEEEADDPLSGVANLFDAAMVFAVALLLSLVMYLGISDYLFKEEFTMVKNPGKPNMEIIIKKGRKIERYKVTRKTLRGEGRRIGTAYQLANGNIVYVPEVDLEEEGAGEAP